jgi:putative ABC transport system permease protein
MKDAGAERRAVGALLRQFTWRHWRRRWRSTLLLVGILGLGVGVFLSIRLASRAAVTGFSLFTESLSGESDYLLRSPVGAPLPESALADLRERLDPLPVAIVPVVAATVAEVADGSRPSGEGPPVQVLGVDLVALRNAADDGVIQSIDSAGDSSGFRLGGGSHAFVSAGFAEARGLAVGAAFSLAVNDRIVPLKVAALLKGDPLGPGIPDNLILMDLPDAQSMLGMTSQISRIELRIPEGADAPWFREKVREILTNAAGVPWRVETPDDRRESAEKMTRAFRLNLTVLSTLALLVGIYLILQALEAAVVRRRPEIAILLSLGVEAGTIRRLWLIESLILGSFGGALGVLLGWGAAQLAVGGIARTVNGLYHSTTTASAALHPGEACFGIVFGMIASVAAGWWPARDAAETPPAQILRSGSRAAGPAFLSRPLLGAVLAVAAAATAFAPPWATAEGDRIPVGGYAAALLWLGAISILSGFAFRPVSRLIMAFGRKWPEWTVAGSQLRKPTGRHRLAVAGLIAAVGMSAGMGILVHSFEGTLTGWIGQMLRADLYVATAGAGNADNANRLPAETWRAIAQDPDVEGIDAIRRHVVEFRNRTIRLAGSQYYQHEDRGMRMRWIEDPGDRTPQRFFGSLPGGEIPAWINEAMSRRFGIGRGDIVEVPTPAGLRRMTVLGVYADYSDEGGIVLTRREFTAAWFGDDSVSNLAAYLKPGGDPAAVLARWEAAYPALVFRENARLRADALRVFHETFSVTHALEAIGVAVAVIGLGLALASLLVERANELATLKSVGFTRAQIARSAAVEGGALALVGLAGGILLSFILGDLLIRVINRQSFGWTLDYRIPWRVLAGLVFLTLVSSTVVTAAVGHRGANLRSDRRE